MFAKKINEISKLSFENNFIEVYIKQKKRVYPLSFGSYIDSYSDQDQKKDDFEQMIVGESIDNAVAILILKDYPRIVNRQNKKSLPLKM